MIDDDRKLLRTITIEVYEGGMLDVREGDRFCNGLCFDEILGQIVSMVHPKLGEPCYRMLTEQEWADWRDRIRNR